MPDEGNAPKLLDEAGLADRAKSRCRDVAKSVLELGASIGRRAPAAAAAQPGLFDITRSVVMNAGDHRDLAKDLGMTVRTLRAEGSRPAASRLPWFGLALRP